MFRKWIWPAALMLLLSGCGLMNGPLPWALQDGRWMAKYEAEGYTLQADIPAVHEAIDNQSREKAEKLAELFIPEVKQRLDELGEEKGSGVWVLQGEHTAIEGFADSVALVEYAYLPRNAHGSYQIETMSYRAGSGEVLTLEELFDTGTDVYRVLSGLSRWMLIHTGQLGDYTNEEWIKTGTEPIPENFSAFMIRPEGLELIFAPYQVGPWALGEQRVTLPWPYLAGYLNPETSKAVGVMQEKAK
jgi:hypothetical protein